jgi:hypothetical protein
MQLCKTTIWAWRDLPNWLARIQASKRELTANKDYEEIRAGLRSLLQL